MSDAIPVNLDFFGRVIRPGDFLARAYQYADSVHMGVSYVLKSDAKGLRVANVRRSYREAYERVGDATVKRSQATIIIPREMVSHQILELFDK